jgi:hypothetical protein
VRLDRKHSALEPGTTGDAACRVGRAEPMPGKTGGFNNNEINGKSRNPDTTTPGTGPANANAKQKH